MSLYGLLCKETQGKYFYFAGKKYLLNTRYFFITRYNSFN
jgi:hypothetical protein